MSQEKSKTMPMQIFFFFWEGGGGGGGKRGELWDLCKYNVVNIKIQS